MKKSNVSIAVNASMVMESIRRDYKAIIDLRFKVDRTKEDIDMIQKYTSAINLKEQMVRNHSNASHYIMSRFNRDMSNINSALQAISA